MKTLIDTNFRAQIVMIVALALAIVGGCAEDSPVELDGPDPLKDRSCFRYADHLHTIGLLALPGASNSTAVRGGMAYVAAGDHGLHVVDVGAPTVPEYRGSVILPGAASDVVATDSLVCVAFGSSGLVIIDAGDPDSPTIVGSAQTPGRAGGLAVSGNIAYVADDVIGLMLFDITDPHSPSPMGVENSPGRAVDVALSGTVAYVADEVAGLRVVNANDPWHPWLANVIPMPAVASRVAVAGEFAYVAASEAGLQTVDISTLGAESVVNSLPTPERAIAVDVSGSTIFVADGTAGTLVVDGEDPYNAAIVNHVATGVSSNGVTFDSGILFVAEGTDGLRVVNVVNPLPPPITDALMPVEEEAVTHVAAEAAMSFAVGTTTGLFGARMQNSTMTLTGTESLTLTEVTDLAVWNGMIFVAGGLDGIHIFDAGTSGVISHSGTVPFVGNVEAIAVDDSLVYIVTDGPVFGVFRLGDDASSTVSIPGAKGTAVGAVGDISYVLSSNRQLHLVDVSDLESPFTVGAYPLAGSGVKFLQVEGFAFLVTSNRFQGSESGVAVYDIQFPFLPRQIGFLRIADGWLYNPVDAALSGTILYVAMERGGVQVIDVADPTNLVRIGEISTEGMTTGVAVASGNVFVADGVGGLIAYPADECQSAR